MAQLGGQVGQIILQAAQGIVAQKQKEMQFALAAQEFEEQVKQQEKVLDLRQEEMEVRQRTVKVQEDQLQRTLGFDPAKRAQATATLAKTQAETGLAIAKTATTGTTGGRKLTDNQRFDAISDIEKRSVRLEMSQVALAHEDNGGAAVPRLGTPQEYFGERRRLQGLVNKFQTSSAGLNIEAMRSLTGERGDFEIDKIIRQLAALDAFLGSEDFMTARNKLDTQGADPQTRQSIIDNFYAPFKDQLSPNAGPARIKAFDFGTIPTDQVNDAWSLFERGNVEVLTEKVLDATGGTFTAADQKAFEAEILQRFPTPGEKQDDAIASWRRMFERIKAQRITE